jgi:hypothetical protein
VELRHTIAQQSSLFTGLGTRLTTLFSVLVGTISAAIAIERAVTPRIPTWAFGSLVVVVVIVMAAAYVTARTLWSSASFWVGEDPDALAKFSGGDPAEFRVSIIQEYAEMVRDNRDPLLDRANAFLVTMSLLLAAALLLAITALLLYVF